MYDFITIDIIIGGLGLQEDLGKRHDDTEGALTMIVGSIKDDNAAGVAFPDAIKRALDYIRGTDFSKVSDGRYEIDGKRVYATVERYTTRKENECRPESHRRYADVQFVAEGAELIGWCPLTPALKVTKPYDEEKDIVFYERLEPESYFALSEGGFAVLMPKDIHCPCCAVDNEPSPVLKVVVKVAVELCEEDK